MSYKKFEFTDDQQDELIKLYKTNYNQWRQKCSKMIKSNESRFNIINAGKNELNYNEFKDNFDVLKEELIELIFNDIDKKIGNSNKIVKITQISRWISNNKGYKQRKIIKDEEWLYNTLRAKTVQDFDSNEDAKIQFNEFYEFFKNDNINKSLLKILFDLIDKNKDGDISIREFMQWKCKKDAKSELLNALKDKDYVITDDNDNKTDYLDDEIKERKPNEYPDAIYVQSGSGKWRECCVIETKGNEWKIHYQGFKPEFDEWIQYNSKRISYKKPNGVVPKLKKKPENIKRVWVLSPSKKIWREAIVIDNPKNSNQWKIHYISYHDKYDEFVIWNGERCRLKRPNGNIINVGDNFSCYSVTFKAWLEAECIKVDDNENKITICYVGSNDRFETLPMDSNRISLNHKNYNAPEPK